MDVKTEADAWELIRAGCRFDIEELTTGMISMTCMIGQGEKEECLSIEVVENGPPVIGAVKKLVKDAYIVLGW